MTSPSKSIKETPTENVQVHARKMAGQKLFGILPANVMANQRLSAAAKVVFAAMAMEFHLSGQVAISHQAMATLCGLARMTVSNGLAQLQQEGLIEPLGSPIKQVQSYRLVHPKFVVKPAPETEVRHACAKCGKFPRKRLTNAGYCDSCERKLAAETNARIAAAEVSVAQQIDRLVSQPKKKTA